MPRPIRAIPWLTQTKTGHWYVNWYEEKTRRSESLSLRTIDAGEAQARYAAFLANQGEFRSPILGAGLTVSQACDHYNDEHAQSHKVVDNRRRYILAEHLKAWFKDTPLTAVNEQACMDYEAARRLGSVGWKDGTNRPASTGTIRLELGCLRAVANHAMKKQRIGPTANPPTSMPVIVLPREDVRRKQPYLTKDELKLVFRYADQPLSDFITLAYYTGARRRSIEGLHPSQVDLERGLIDLTHPNETQAQMQSKKRRPMVPIFDGEMRAVVERLMRDNGQGKFLLGGTQQHDFYVMFRGLLRSLKLEHKAFPHILRHSRATHLLVDGHSIYDVAKLLGDDLVTVAKTYGHHAPDELKAKLQHVLKAPHLRVV